MDIETISRKHVIMLINCVFIFHFLHCLFSAKIGCIFLYNKKLHIGYLITRMSNLLKINIDNIYFFTLLTLICV